MSGERSRAKEDECPLCPLMERFCELLGDGECLRLLDGLREGRVSAEEFARRVVNKHGAERVNWALREARKALGR